MGAKTSTGIIINKYKDPIEYDVIRKNDIKEQTKLTIHEKKYFEINGHPVLADDKKYDKILEPGNGPNKVIKLGPGEQGREHLRTVDKMPAGSLLKIKVKGQQLSLHLHEGFQGFNITQGGYLEELSLQQMITLYQEKSGKKKGGSQSLIKSLRKHLQQMLDKEQIVLLCQYNEQLGQRLKKIMNDN